MTVKEVSKLTGVSVRALHYYDEIGLLTPTATTDSGYRLYDNNNLERLQQIMLFRELEIPLKEIKKIIDNPGFDKGKVLLQQIELLTLKKEHIESLIDYAKLLKEKGESEMDFKVFDNKKIEEYKSEAKKLWGNTDEYKEYETKTSDYSAKKQEMVADGLMNIFKEFGDMAQKSPADNDVQMLVKKLQEYITSNFYTCTKPVLSSLGQMYSAGGEMTENIDVAGGKGTAEFAAKAIAEYCK